MKAWLPLVVLLATTPAPAVAPEAPRPAPIPARGAFLALSVADLDASVKWYAEAFGLRTVMRPPPQNGAAVAVLEGEGLLVELLQIDGSRPLAEAAPGVKGNLFVHGWVKAGFMVDDFDGTLAKLRARGVQIAMGPFPARKDQRANVIVRDNSGNLLQILAR